MAAPATDHPQREEITEFFGHRAAEVDSCGTDVRPGLRFLGERGLLGLGAPDNASGELPTALHVVEDVAASCMSSGFSLWAQRMTIEYLSRAPGTAEVSAELAELRAGTRIGVTAMAPAMRYAAGLEELPVRAEPEDGGWRLTGPIPWASNLFEDALVVVPARTDSGDCLAVVLPLSAPGVTVRDAPQLLALGATGSSSVALDGVHVPDSAVLSRDLLEFVRAIRPTFLLVQTAFCTGLAGASRRAAGELLTGLNEQFSTDCAEIVERHDSVRERLFRYAADLREPSPAQLLELRLDAARVAEDATRLEAAVAGGRGYVATSATSRRLREAAFLPIQAPTEGQLRWELSQSA